MVEHYHWGLAAFIAGRLSKTYGKIGDGFGTMMVFTEAFQPQPFGIGKEEWQVQGNMALTAVLGGALIVAAVYGPNPVTL